MNRPEENDELIRRYREAGAQDTRRPSTHVRDAVRAHAAMITASRAAGPAPSPTPAANQSRWKISLLASIALAGLTGLVVLQFDRGTADEQEIALGRPAPAVVPASPAPPPPPVADATAARSETPAARPVTPAPRSAAPLARPAPDAGRSAPATASPAPAAESAPSPPSLAGQEAPAPARERRADALRDEPSEKAMSAAAPQAIARSAAPAPASAARAPALRMPASPQESLAAQAPRSAAALTAALHQSARAGQLADLDALLQQGASVNAPDGAGRTALSLAVIHGHSALVRRLLALGANPALVDRDGLDALQHARRLGREDMARLIEARP